MSSWNEGKFEAGHKYLDQADIEELLAEAPPVPNVRGESQWPFEEELGPDPNPEYKGKWGVKKVRCRCGKTQVSVYPAICTRVECAKCHKWIRL